MSRKSVRLTADHWSHLEPDDPAFALLLPWLLDRVTFDRITPGTERAEVERWTSRVLSEWGNPGRVCLSEERPIGFAIYGPAQFFPGAAALPTAPVSPDAILLAGVFVEPQWQHQGLGRILVQGAAADLIGRKQPVLEAFSDSRPRPSDGRPAGLPFTRGASDHVLPTPFLEAVGFRAHRAHPVFPRMRMELRTTLSWMSEVEQRLARLVPRLSPQPKKATRMGRLLG